MVQLALFNLPEKHLHQPKDHADLRRHLAATVPGGGFTVTFPGPWAASNARAALGHFAKKHSFAITTHTERIGPRAVKMTVLRRISA